MADYCESVKVLLDNSSEHFAQASEILIRFCDNVLSNPSVQKYRRLRLANPIIQNKLLTISGGMECLFDMGFDSEEDGEYLSLPMNSSLTQMRKIHNDLMTEKRKREKTGSSTGQMPTGGAASPVRPTVPGAGAGGVSAASMFRQEQSFFAKLQSSFDHVLVYEDPVLKQKARDVMPVAEFQKEADEKLRLLTARGAGNINKKELILLALLNWFKNSFFSWVNAPTCDRCGGETKQVGSAPPLPEDLRWGANRVESYCCQSCSNNVRFPRYNHPGKLLETHRGRCGEWANCFTLCCRALDFEARYVLDWTDHVWTEVYSDREQRWVHCDPCENICDKPLLYESGWGKKLTYVIAFSKDDIQDVSWRYSANHDEMRLRRTECREPWLVSQIVKLRNQRQQALPEARRNELTNRCVAELVELLSPPSPNAEQLPGRLSGSVAWRLARGELGNTEAVPQSKVFELTPAEQQSNMFQMKYSCASDKYVIESSGREQPGWESGVYNCSFVQRKVENDWKMAYLARAEGQTSAEISWKFDFTGKKIDTVKIFPGSKTFENGRITWNVCAGDQCILLKANEQNVVTELRGQNSLSLTARLSGGKGSVAWQHTQLFRQSTKGPDSFPLDVRVTLTD